MYHRNLYRLNPSLTSHPRDLQHVGETPTPMPRHGEVHAGEGA